MKNSKLFLGLSLTLIVAMIALGLSIQATAQEGVVQYLEERFKEQSIPVANISILGESPLQLRVTLQGSSEWATFEERMRLHTIEREVFISARQHGYLVDRLVKVLLDNQGKQIYYEDVGFDGKLVIVDVSPSILSDEDTKELATDKINLMFDEKSLHGTSLEVDISSSSGLQTLDIRVIVPSLEEANRVAFSLWSLPYLPLITEINSQGAQIVIYEAEIKDAEGKTLLNYMYDFQLQSGSLSKDKNLIDLSFGHPLPESLYLPAETLPPTETATATP